MILPPDEEIKAVTFEDSALVLEDHGGPPYKLGAPFQATIHGVRHSAGVFIPAGFPTDLASIPQIFSNLIPKSGTYDKAAVLHDWLYQTGSLSRAQADRVLLIGMDELGVGRVLRNTIYAAVRVGGRFPWNRYREEKASQ